MTAKKTQSCRRYVGTIPAMLGLLGISILVQAGGCPGNMPPPPPRPDVTDVAMQGIAFVPKDVTIPVGNSVRWINMELLPIPHTVTSGDSTDVNPGALFESGLFGPGQSFELQFNEVGVFVYFCRVHPLVPAMRGATVTVVPAP